MTAKQIQQQLWLCMFLMPRKKRTFIFYYIVITVNRRKTIFKQDLTLKVSIPQKTEFVSQNRIRLPFPSRSHDSTVSRAESVKKIVLLWTSTAMETGYRIPDQTRTFLLEPSSRERSIFGWIPVSVQNKNLGEKQKKIIAIFVQMSSLCHHMYNMHTIKRIRVY